MSPTVVYDAIAKSLRDFGYGDVTTKMIEEIAEAYKKGKRGMDLPHGIIGPFAQDQLEDAVDSGLLSF